MEGLIFGILRYHQRNDELAYTFCQLLQNLLLRDKAHYNGVLKS